jgi:hypothetical protein
MICGHSLEMDPKKNTPPPVCTISAKLIHSMLSAVKDHLNDKNLKIRHESHGAIHNLCRLLEPTVDMAATEEQRGCTTPPPLDTSSFVKRSRPAHASGEKDITLKLNIFFVIFFLFFFFKSCCI